jgi:5-methyltetrahydrofolate--homocysteine methyltransferase
VLTSLGVSNVSFGLGKEARAVLNSVFLYHCVQAGLDMAIVNAAEVRPYAEIGEEDQGLAEDLIFNRDPQALAQADRALRGPHLRSREREEEAQEAAMTLEQRIHYQILHRKPAGIEALIDEAVTRQDPVAVLNTVLLPAMKEVGDKFGAGELILPFVLQSAEVMKKAVAAARELPREVGQREQGPRGARHRLRRRARHRQEPGEDHPQQQRLHRVRSRQAGPGHHHPREGEGGRRHRDRTLGAAGLDQQADADLRR